VPTTSTTKPTTTSTTSTTTTEPSPSTLLSVPPLPDGVELPSP
jgi:hypothetical protein